MPEWTVERRWDRTREQSSLDGGQLRRKADHSTAVLTANAIMKCQGRECIWPSVVSHPFTRPRSHRIYEEYGMVTDRDGHARVDYPEALLLDHALDIP